MILRQQNDIATFIYSWDGKNICILLRAEQDLDQLIPYLLNSRFVHQLRACKPHQRELSTRRPWQSTLWKGKRYGDSCGKGRKCHFHFKKLQWHFLLMETLGFWSAWRTLPQPFTITLSKVIYIQSSQTETAYPANQKRKKLCIPDLESWCFF